jgi:hypothetical protein
MLSTRIDSLILIGKKINGKAHKSIIILIFLIVKRALRRSLEHQVNANC